MRLLALFLLFGLAFSLNVGAASSSGHSQVRLLTIEGVINPLTSRYLERGLREAADARDADFIKGGA